MPAQVPLARALKPLMLKRLGEHYGLDTARHRLMHNSRSGRVTLLVPARSLLSDDSKRIARFEMIRPLKRTHVAVEQHTESSWEAIELPRF